MNYFSLLIIKQMRTNKNPSARSKRRKIREETDVYDLLAGTDPNCLNR